VQHRHESKYNLVDQTQFHSQEVTIASRQEVNSLDKKIAHREVQLFALMLMAFC